jgi:hypothetical protein
MATFRCLQSGNTVTFTYQHDIDSMKRKRVGDVAGMPPSTLRDKLATAVAAAEKAAAEAAAAASAAATAAH